MSKFKDKKLIEKCSKFVKDHFRPKMIEEIPLPIVERNSKKLLNQSSFLDTRVAGLYYFKDKTIILDSFFNKKDINDIKTLIHEMTHHYQNYYYFTSWKPGDFLISDGKLERQAVAMEKKVSKIVFKSLTSS